MDSWKYFDITHKEHLLCNPMSAEKLQRLVELLRLDAGGRVLDIAAGKGEFVLRIAERYGASGVAVDLSPFCIRDITARLQGLAAPPQIELLCMNGADYTPRQGEIFDMSACIGASWVFGGHRSTLLALMGMTKPGGWVVVGEPYWVQPAPQEFLDASGISAGDYETHAGNVRIGEQLGLRLSYCVVSNHDDWDQYEGLQWYAAHEYARLHPDDPDVAELLERVEHSKELYLKWGRDCFGWAIYVFRKGR